MNKDKNNVKKKNWYGPSGGRGEVTLEPDLPEFAHLGGLGQPPPQKNNWKKKNYKFTPFPSNKENFLSKEDDEEVPEPEKPRVVRPEVKNSPDFSKPLLYWITVYCFFI